MARLGDKVDPIKALGYDPGRILVMARPTAIDRAIAVLDGEIAVLQLAKAKLQQQQKKTTVVRVITAPRHPVHVDE